MKTILWISRHYPNPDEHTLLEEIFGEKVTILQQNLQFIHIESLVKEIRKANYDDIVVNLPLEIIGKLCQKKIYPIQPVYKVVSITEDRQRIYKFLRFERIHKVIIKKETLKKK
jgi:hypothetical protein